MQTIPLTAKPSQTVDVVLSSQKCTINLYQKNENLFLDLFVGGTAVLCGQICRDRCRIVRLAYLGFSGDLAFIDTQGTEDPVYSGLNDRWQLLYLSASDL